MTSDRSPRLRASGPLALVLEAIAAFVGIVALTFGFLAVHADHVHRGGEGDSLRHRHAWVGPHEHGPQTHVHGSVEAPDSAETDPTSPEASQLEATTAGARALVLALGSSPAPSGEAPTGAPSSLAPRSVDRGVDRLPPSLAAGTVRSRGPPSRHTV